MVKLDYAKIKFRKKNQKALLGALYIYIYISQVINRLCNHLIRIVRLIVYHG